VLAQQFERSALVAQLELGALYLPRVFAVAFLILIDRNLLNRRGFVAIETGEMHVNIAFAVGGDVVLHVRKAKQRKFSHDVISGDVELCQPLFRDFRQSACNLNILQQPRASRIRGFLAVARSFCGARGVAIDAIFADKDFLLGVEWRFLFAAGSHE
jgi:hypothetical protein